MQTQKLFNDKDTKQSLMELEYQLSKSVDSNDKEQEAELIHIREKINQFPRSCSADLTLEEVHNNNFTGIMKVRNEEAKLNISSHKKTISEIKQQTINNLLNKVDAVDYVQVCLELGWKQTQNDDGSSKPPAQKHFKVAIIHMLLKVAQTNEWHIIRDTELTYIYSGCFWIVLDKDEYQNFLKNVAIKQGYPVIEARDSLFINKLYEQAIKDCFFSSKRLVKQSMINLNNCTLVLSSHGIKIKDFDYKDFLTHQLDFNYDATAINQTFLNFLDEVLPDKFTQRTLQEIAGYLFIKGLKLEKIFFLYGTGANGKSVFFEVINGLLGTENISHFSLESLTDSKGYYRAKIKDKIVNYGTDVKLNRIDAGHFKTLASCEPIEARLPYGQPFILLDYAKLIFNINVLDDVNIERTHGFIRRILIVPFNITIDDCNQDKNLHKKILKDKAGVLNWIIKGAESVIKNEDIFVSDECNKFKAKFIKETDNVALFIESENYIKDSNIVFHS